MDAVVKKEEKKEEELIKIPDKGKGGASSMMQRVQELAEQGQMGNLTITDAEAAILYAPVPADEILIRPDGHVYLSWTFYAKRLRDTFRMTWAMVSMDEPKMAGELVIWGFYLSIKGQIVGMPAMGECRYQSSNRTMSWGDAVEGAKSNALMRLCKSIGIGLEMWDHEFVDAWRKENAEQKIVEGKMIWVKKRKEGTKNGK